MFLRGGGTLILITGGARSGKSRFAQECAEQSHCGRRLFVATAVACDPEMSAKIARHRRDREDVRAPDVGSGDASFGASRDRGLLWKTLEEPLQLPERLPKEFLKAGSVCLFDCLPTFVTNHLMSGKKPEQVLSRVRRLLDVFRKSESTVLLVTNEVGLGIVPDNPLARAFRDLLGEVNQDAAKRADQVHFLVSGIPWRVK